MKKSILFVSNLVVALLFHSASIAQSDQKAVEIMQAYIKAIGGKEKLQAVKSLMSKMTATTPMGDLTITNTVQEGKSYMKTEMAGSVVMEKKFDGKTVHMTGMTGDQKITEAAVIKAEEKQARMFSELDQLLSEDVIKKFVATEDLDGKKVHKLEISDKDKSTTTQYFDAASGLLVRTISEVDAMGSKSKQTVDMSDYQEVGGVKFPHSIKMNGGMVPFPLEMKVTSFMINNEIPAELFIIK